MASNMATINVRIPTPRNDPKIPSVCAVIPALPHERDRRSMFLGWWSKTFPIPGRCFWLTIGQPASTRCARIGTSTGRTK